MRADEYKERMHINDIIAGLDHIERAAGQGSGTDLPHGLAALREGCESFRDFIESPVMSIAPGIPWHMEQIRDMAEYVAASMDLVRLFNQIPDKLRVKGIRKHLALIGRGCFGIAATKNQQHKASRIRDALIARGIEPPAYDEFLDASRKTIELMVGMALLGHTAEVAFEDCVHSEKDGPNPDVIVRFDDLRVGIACKSITTTNRERIFERIRSGVRQITRACREKMCDTGLVLLDISSLLDHDLLYKHPQPNCAWSMGEIPDIIKERTAGAFARALGLDAPQKIGELIGDLYTRPFIDLGPTPVTPIAEPCVLVYGHSLMIGANASAEGPVYAKVLIDYYFNDQGRTKGLVTELNKRLHGQ